MRLSHEAVQTCTRNVAHCFPGICVTGFSSMGLWTQKLVVLDQPTPCCSLSPLFIWVLSTPLRSHGVLTAGHTASSPGHHLLLPPRHHTLQPVSEEHQVDSSNFGHQGSPSFRVPWASPVALCTLSTQPPNSTYAFASFPGRVTSTGRVWGLANAGRGVWLFAHSDKCGPLDGKCELVMDPSMLLANFKLKHSTELTLTAEFL